MKRIIALLLAAVLLVSLTACKSKDAGNDTNSILSDAVPELPSDVQNQASDPGASEPEPAPAPDSAAPEVSPEPEAERIVTPDELRGSWVLAESNDMAQLEAAFPGAGETGGTMEIGADGLLFWFIGTEGGAGSFTVEDDTLHCQLVSDHNGVAEPVTIELDPSGPTLTMDYSGVSVVWDKVIPPR